MVTILAAFAIAAGVAFLATPPVRRLAEHLNVIAKPDRQRKRHRRLMPLWGGLAIFIAFVISVWLSLQYTPDGQVLLAYRENLFGFRLPFIFFAVLLLTLIGLWDDWQPLPPKVKLLVQLTAVGLVILAGFRLESMVLPFSGKVVVIWNVLGSMLAVGWLIFVINAFNFIDGLDGLASSQAVIMGCALAIGALTLAGGSQDLLTRYQYSLAGLLSASAAGAALGFWRFNHFPARIFLGDAGSNVLGFLLGFSAILLLGRATTAWVPVFVFLVFGWPLFDTIQVIVRRFRRKEPISRADNRHLHHYLLKQGFTNSSAVAFINILVFILCILGLVTTWL